MVFSVRALGILLCYAVFMFIAGSAYSKEIYNSDIENIDYNIFLESKTGLTGWRYQGECDGEAENTYYNISFYSPPKMKDVGGYGILTVKFNNVETTYSGYEFYPFPGEEVCDFIGSYHDGHLLVLDTENWALSKRYLVSIDVKAMEVSSYSYSLKNTDIYNVVLNEGLYLVAGFGVCTMSKDVDWISDIFCDNLTYDRYKKAEDYLKNNIGISIIPEVAGFGKGVFKYYVVSIGEEKYNQKLIDEALFSYLDDVVKKIEKLENMDLTKEYYSSLLAIDSVILESSSLGSELLEREIFKNDAVEMKKYFHGYWNIIYP